MSWPFSKWDKVYKEYCLPIPSCTIPWGAYSHKFENADIRDILLRVQQRIRVDVGLVFGVKINLYLKIKYTFESFHQPAVKL